MTLKTFLYKATAVNGELLYVGITSQTNVRMDAHAKKSEWHALAENIEYFEFQDRSLALAAESAEIANNRPRFNVMGNPDFRPPMGAVKNITIRPSVEQWKAILRLTTSERTKIQSHTIALYKADFERRGLVWPD